MDLEGRMQKLESEVKEGQKTVHELIKMNGELIRRISDLSTKMRTDWIDWKNE